MNIIDEFFEFKISGAIESFIYIHGVTTIEDWKNQIQKIKDKSIASPIFSAYATFGSLNIPFSNIGVIGKKTNIDALEYPFEVFDKWFQTLNLSSYYSDKNVILNMKFCDDIWNNAGAFGWGNAIYAPIEWGETAFINGIKGFNSIKDSWGVIHEINHNFDKTSALFSKRNHLDNNQLSIAELSLLSDTGRWRNPYNTNSEFINKNEEIGWTRLGNSYINIETEDQYDWRLFSSILYTIGTYNYINYVKWDAKNHPNTDPSWEGLDEIRVLSHFFKLNFWPTFKKYVGYIDWLDSEEKATLKQKEMIEEMKQYPAIDFVGNLYATGIYFYDSISKEFKYTNDVISPYEIPAGYDYTFDFEKFINSTNSDFEWDELKFSESKNGAIIKVDPKNQKKLIYSPNKDKIDEIDEFNISIKPKKWSGQSDNYIPFYKWKIKVRQVVNQPILKMFSLDSTSGIEEIFKKMETTESFYRGIGILSNSYTPIIGENNNPVKMEYAFIPREDGKYSFNFLTYDYARVKISQKNSSTTTLNFGIDNSVGRTHSINLKKGEIVKFEISIIRKNDSINSSMFFNTKFLFNDKDIDLNENVLVPNVETFNIENSPINFLTDTKYKYKSRNVNNSLLDRNIANIFNFSKINFGYKKDDYDLNLSENLNNNQPNFEGDIKNLKEINNENYFIGRTLNNILTIDLNFKSNSKVYSILFGNENSDYSDINPTNIKIVSIDENGNEEIMFNGAYENKNKGKFNFINFKKEFNTKKIRIFLKNNYDDFIGLSWILPSSNQYHELNNIISMVGNSSITYKGKWEEEKNEINKNMSSLNNSSLFSNTKDDEIEFTISALGFNIIGLKNNIDSKFDLYIDDKLIYSDISSLSDSKEFNANLYTYWSNDLKVKPMKVKIVHKDNNPLYINYIQTYGNNVNIF